MKKIFIFIAIMLTLALLVIGCSKSTTTTTPPATTAPPATAPATTPSTAAAPHGELVYAVPTLGSEDFSFVQNPTMVLPSIVYERMFRTNRNNSEPQGIYPLLAEKYTKSDDGLTYDIYLRQGIQWQEGWGEMTADDVVFTFDQMKIPDLQNVYSFIFNPPDQGGYMSSYEAIDRYHVRFHLSKPYNMFLLDMTDVPCYILCKKYIEQVGWPEANKHPIGTGPWEWVETVSGDHIKFKANDSYWGQMPGFEYLTLKNVPDISTELMMLKSGEADMAILSPEQAPDALSAGLQLLNVPNESFVSVFFGGQILQSWDTYDPTVPWVTHWDEPADSDWNQKALKVREALCLSIDPQVIIDKIMNGYATLDTLRDHIKTSPNFLPSWQPYPYDPQKAKELLAEAGYSNGFAKPIQMLVPSISQAGINTKAIALYVADCYEAIGLKVDRQVMDPNLISQTWEFGREDAWKSEVSVGFGIIKPVWGSQMALASWSPMHEVAESPTFDQLITQYTVEQDPKVADQIEQQLGTYEYENYFERGLFYAGFLYFFGPKVKDAADIPLPYWQESEVLPFFDFEYVQPAQ
jgi:peptide/nickel transport system substrate-binding protein